MNPIRPRFTLGETGKLDELYFFAIIQTMHKIKRVVIKISGEALGGKKQTGIDIPTVCKICRNIKETYKAGYEVGIVVGGGNFFRGKNIAKSGDERAAGDYIGMLSTVMNSMVLQIELEKIDVPTRVQTAVHMQSLAEPFIRRKAIRHMEKGRVVIFGAGTGLPFHSTDMATVVRALEIGADMILKATQVDGVYSDDPHKNKNARRIASITFRDMRKKNLKVMDLPAVTLAEENSVPIRVFKLFGKYSIADILSSRGEYSEISGN